MPVFRRSSNPLQFFSAPAQATVWEICSKKPSLFVHQIEPFVPDFKARLAFVQCLWTLLRLPTTVEPRYNEGSREDWQNLSAIKRFHYIEVLCHMFHYHWGREIVRYWPFRSCVANWGKFKDFKFKLIDKLINWHHIIKGYLTRFGALRLNRDQVMTLETWLKILTNVSIILWQRLPKTI